MSIETAAGRSNTAQSSSAAARKAKVKSPRSRPPSPLYCAFFLVLSISLAELFENFVSQQLAASVSPTGLVFFDAFSMVVVIVPAFYYFVYRPMKLYAREKVASEKEIRFLSRQLILSADRGKRAVARDLHSQFGQSLASLQFSLGSLLPAFIDRQPEQQQQCENLVNTVAQLGTMVRNISARLSPPQLEELGLVSTLEWAVNDIQNKGGRFSVDFDICDMDDRLPGEIEIALYRIFQEAMDNIIQHSEASRVNICLAGTPSHVSLAIRDNGIGFVYPQTWNDEKSSRGIGLLGMRERIEDLGGEFSFSSTIGEGTGIEVSILHS